MIKKVKKFIVFVVIAGIGGVWFADSQGYISVTNPIQVNTTALVAETPEVIEEVTEEEPEETVTPKEAVPTTVIYLAEDGNFSETPVTDKQKEAQLVVDEVATELTNVKGLPFSTTGVIYIDETGATIKETDETKALDKFVLVDIAGNIVYARDNTTEYEAQTILDKDVQAQARKVVSMNEVNCNFTGLVTDSGLPKTEEVSEIVKQGLIDAYGLAAETVSENTETPEEDEAKSDSTDKEEKQPERKSHKLVESQKRSQAIRLAAERKANLYN